MTMMMRKKHESLVVPAHGAGPPRLS